MESLWKFHGENHRLGYGETVEKMWNICGESTHWKIIGWKILKSAIME